MSAQLESWSHVVQSVAATPGPLRIYVQTQDQGRKWKALTPEQYKEAGSIWEKVSLNEILNLSEQVLKLARQDAPYEIRSLALNTDINDQTEELLKKRIIASGSGESAKALIAGLAILLNRYTEKHPQENQDLENRLKVLVDLGKPHGVSVLCRSASKELQERIFTNMEWFEDAIRHQGTAEHPSAVSLDLEDLRARFATPQDVETKWIAKFGIDSGNNFTTNPVVAQLAVESRARIPQIVKIWTNLIAFEKEHTPVEVPAAAPMTF